ncbi:HlyD family efflux transporter periplasmic adaptor subunit [Aliiroseovarius subalbicans]|uniref:efflux RND transporter periplasmic adaptor subunit n=1 Tax=Aliiroseovarius subalbicans TaxID=2925840 RepID=UPI001F576F12|nr:HlyD family efflux transporter periplasmic adaptor subunit [Aliiroseovarius subalbicans]MCI2398985.1 HlyD family efflux transporter periplasmic adaptor subunit [Aliiroseovarius subalbicans]
MRMLTRTSFGLAVGGAALAVLFSAGGMLYRAWEDGSSAATNVRTPRERIYSVTVGVLEAEVVTPVVTGYGHLTSGRTLDLRSAVAGTLVELSENFRDGGVVAAGDVLFRINPSRLETGLALAKADVAEAQAELAQAKAALELGRLEVGTAQVQLDLRLQAVARQEDLRARGVATEADVETAVLARAAAEQTLVSRRQIVAGDEARVGQAAITVTRREIMLDDAQRSLAETTVTAPFAGVISDASAAQGRLVSANEQLGELIDTGDIEVVFRVTNNQYSRLLNAQGALRKTDMSVLVQRGRAVTEFPATLDRAGSGLEEGQVGRLVYAKLIEPDLNLIQTGDFVTVRIPEKPLEGVASIPATAATADGRILLIADGNRLEEVQVTLLRHQGDMLIVGDFPAGSQYVKVRALQLGSGIMVTPVAEWSEGDEQAAPAPTDAVPDTIALDDARRARIIAFIEASEQMKPEMRDKFLKELGRADVPIATVEKFEAKMAESE